jgi:hypothetical protein
MPASFERLTDYFVAVKELGAENDPVRQRAIAAVLGFIEEEVVTEPAPIIPPVPPVDRKPVATQEQTRTPTLREAFGGVMGTRKRSTRRKYTITPLPPSRHSRPDWLDHVTALAPPRDSAPPPPPAPLLTVPWSRAVLSTAISVDTVTNAIDVHAVVDAVSRGIPLRQVPRRVIPTLSRGVQLLVDRGPGSAPFLGDQEVLIQQIRAVAGNDRVQVLRFDPSRRFVAGSGPRTRWKDYFSLTPPLLGLTVVLISDLGIASVPLEPGAVPTEWRDFITRLRARGNRVIAFVPYGPRRWPPMLRRLLGILPWDRRTSVQSVRRLLGRRGRRPVIA